MIDSMGIIFLSYIIGCLFTIILVFIGFIYYGKNVLECPIEHEQFQKIHSVNENHCLTNSTIEMINYFFQFIFQELKDTSKFRRYIVKKLLIEFNDIKKTQIGQIFLREISIENFSTGKECPILTDIQLERQDRDERKLIKNVVTRVYIDYKDGFSITLDVKLIFNYHCQIYIKIKRIQGRLRLEFRREPFSHWLIVFQDDPRIDLDIKSYLFSRENRQLAHLIAHRIRRIIRQKQTWPSYKFRYQPFFPSTKYPLFPEILCPNAEKLIPGRFILSVQSCDRFHIPFDVIQKDKYPLMISMDISEENCDDFLRINRNQWLKINIIIQMNIHRLLIKEINYINRKEFLIEHFESIPEDIEEREHIINGIKDENIFLIEINHQQINDIKQIQRLLHNNRDQISIVVGIPRLHCIRVPRTIQFLNTIRQETTIKNSLQDTTVILMMNENLIPKARSKHPFVRNHSENIDMHSSLKLFDDQEFKFHIGTNKRFLNVCLWCEPRLDFDVPTLNKKYVLLGYTSASLPQIVSDAQMSFNRETNVQLNFRSIYPDSPIYLNSQLIELSTHKGFDRNIIHGYITIQIRHEPEFEMIFNDEKSSLNNFDINNESDIHSDRSIINNPGLRRRELRKLNNTQTTHSSSRLSTIVASTYAKLRELKRRRDLRKARNSSDINLHEDISETDLQDMINKCLSEENFDRKSLEEFFHKKSFDHSIIYTKGHQSSDELLGNLTLEERRQYLETKIFYLQQEIDLQNEIRDEIIIEHNDHLTDEHTCKILQAKLDNIDEKLQALYALTLFYCSGLL